MWKKWKLILAVSFFNWKSKQYRTGNSSVPKNTIRSSTRYHTAHELNKLTRDLRWFITHRSLQPCSSHMPDFRAHCGSIRSITDDQLCFPICWRIGGMQFSLHHSVFRRIFSSLGSVEIFCPSHLHKNNLLSSGGWLNMLVSCRDRVCHRLLSQCVVYVCQNLQADFLPNKCYSAKRVALHASRKCC